MRGMIDTTHNGLPTALPVIKAMPAGNIVGLYDTGSSGIVYTPADLATIPSNLYVVTIDQAFTGSPNLKATIRDCENGAWSLTNAVNKTGWNVARPTLYVGYPDTVQQAYDLGWRGDVWLALSSSSPPTKPPAVLPGINYVAIQWNYSNPNYDISVVFDPFWPGKAPVTMSDYAVTTNPPGNWEGPAVFIGKGVDGNIWQVVLKADGKTWESPTKVA